MHGVYDFKGNFSRTHDVVCTPLTTSKAALAGTSIQRNKGTKEQRFDVLARRIPAPPLFHKMRLV